MLLVISPSINDATYSHVLHIKDEVEEEEEEIWGWHREEKYIDYSAFMWCGYSIGTKSQMASCCPKFPCN